MFFDDETTMPQDGNTPAADGTENTEAGDNNEGATETPAEGGDNE